METDAPTNNRTYEISISQAGIEFKEVKTEWDGAIASLNIVEAGRMLVGDVKLIQNTLPSK